METTVRIEGTDTLIRKLREVKASIGDTLADAGVKGMLVVEAAAKDKCPTSTGELKRSITTKVVESGTDSVLVATGTNVAYAPPVEYGSGPHNVPISALEPWARKRGIPVWALWKSISLHGTAPHPFLRPALDENVDEIGKVVNAELRKAIEEATR